MQVHVEVYKSACDFAVESLASNMSHVSCLSVTRCRISRTIKDLTPFSCCAKIHNGTNSAWIDINLARSVPLRAFGAVIHVVRLPGRILHLLPPVPYIIACIQISL